jgi:cation transport regulator
MTTDTLMTYVLSLLLKKVVVPADFHDKADAIKEMLKDDVSGLVDSLTDFAVETASVDFNVETDNDEFNKILNTWLEEINIDYNGKIPSGLKPLAKEYFKERWKGASFPVLKVGGWESKKGVKVPTKLFFVDGGSIYAKDKDGEELTLLGYDYYLGKARKHKLDANVIFSRPYGRWFDKYPTPYLIKRGVFHNWRLIESIKNKEMKILDQIIPYIMLVKKGSEALAVNNIKTYSNTELASVIEEFKCLMEKVKDGKEGEHPVRASNFDEKIEHLIPDLETIFKPALFASAERNILAGLGFIDIAEAVSTSRRESILNPKAFIGEINSGIEDFQQILKELVIAIKKKNGTHIKYMNEKFYITASPVKEFLTDDIQELIRQQYDRGNISRQTAVEILGLNFRTEKHKRDKEVKDGLDMSLYPPVIRNQEGQGLDVPGITPEDQTQEHLPDDKKDETEKQEYDQSGKKDNDLEIAPYKKVGDLPPRVKKNLSPDLQRVFLRVFNRAYEQYQNDTRAFRVAWSVIRKIARKNKKGKWIRKKKRVAGKLVPITLTRAVLEEAVAKVDKEIIDETMATKTLEIKDKQSALLDHLLKDIKKKD